MIGTDCTGSCNITTIVITANHTHGEVYSIQHYHKVCQWFATGRWFSPVSSTNKTDRQDITEILKGGVKHHNP